MKKNVCFLMAFSFLFVPPSLFPQKTRIGVLTFASKGGVSQSEASTITDIFCVELVNCGIFDVLDRAKMDEILKEQEFQSSGCTETECVVKIGKIVNMEKMVYGTVSKLGTRFFITINSVDVETGRVEHAAKTSMETMDEVEGTMGDLISEFAGTPLPESTPAKEKPTGPANRSKYFPQITKMDDNAVEIDSTTRDQMLSVGQVCDVVMFNRSRNGKVEAVTLGRVVIKVVTKTSSKAETVAGLDTISPGDFLDLAPVNRTDFWPVVGATMASPTWGGFFFKNNPIGIGAGMLFDAATAFFLLDISFSQKDKYGSQSGMFTSLYYGNVNSSGFGSTFTYFLIILGASVGSHIPFAIINGISSLVNNATYEGFLQDNAPLPPATIKASLVPDGGINVALCIPL